MVTIKDVEELGFELVSKKKEVIAKPMKDSEVPESVVKALIEGHKVRLKMMGEEEPQSTIFMDDGTEWSCFYDKRDKAYRNFFHRVNGDVFEFERNGTIFDCYVADGDEHICKIWMKSEYGDERATMIGKETTVSDFDNFTLNAMKRDEIREIEEFGDCTADSFEFDYKI